MIYSAVLLIALLLEPCCNRMPIHVEVASGPIDDTCITRPWKKEHG